MAVVLRRHEARFLEFGQRALGGRGKARNLPVGLGHAITGLLERTFGDWLIGFEATFAPAYPIGDLLVADRGFLTGCGLAPDAGEAPTEIGLARWHDKALGLRAPEGLVSDQIPRGLGVQGGFSPSHGRSGCRARGPR